MPWLLFFSLGSLWLIRTTRIILFYLYLWQLKEYHLGRFLDHFRTEKGRGLIWHPWKIAKIFLFLMLLGFFFFPATASNLGNFWLITLYCLYLGEAGLFLKDAVKKSLKKPIFTKKTVFLFLICSLATIFWILNSVKLSPANFFFAVLIVDIFLPIIVSAIVVGLQPLAWLWRLRMINQAKQKRESLKNLIVVGITGSYGKTSTKEFLRTILAEKFSVLATREHQNSEIGIAKCVLDELKPEHQVFIVEMGAYGKGGIKLLAEIVKPKIGIVTGVNEQHLALFGTMENLISAEGGKELIEILPEKGVVIVNADNSLIQNSKFKIQNYNSKVKIKFCSAGQKTDFWAENIKVEKEWLHFRAHSKDGEMADFRVNLVGAQNIENILLAAACAKELGISLKEIARAAERIKPEQGAMKPLKGRGGVDVIDSTYSANPDGVIAGLEHLKLWSGQKVVIMPCLIELGPAARKVHQKIGRKIGEVCDLAIIATKDWFNELKEAAVGAGMQPVNIIFLENLPEILEKIKNYSGEGNVILLEGRVPSKLIKYLTSQ